MRRVNEFSTTSSWTGNPTGYRSGNTSLYPGDGQFGWDYHTGFQNTRSGTPVATDYRAFEERLLLRPSRVTSSIPMDHYSQPTRIIIFNHHLDRGMNPTFPPILHRPVSQRNRYVPSNVTDESKLSAEEQETVLKNLHRQTYKHVPKKSRRVSLYYRDHNRDPTSKPPGKNTDEDGKICAVCLEDFEHGEEVMLTCCKHMFHEECV